MMDRAFLDRAPQIFCNKHLQYRHVDDSIGYLIEHYEIAGYQTAISLAKRNGASEAVGLLEQSLSEEEAAALKLRKIASGLLKNAAISEK